MRKAVMTHDRTFLASLSEKNVSCDLPLEELRALRSKVMTKYRWPAFSHAAFIGLGDLRMKPSHYNCELCKDWDGVNGCWKNKLTIALCDDPLDLDWEWDPWHDDPGCDEDPCDNDPVLGR